MAIETFSTAKLLRINTLNAHFTLITLIAALYGPCVYIVVQDFAKVWPALAVSFAVGCFGIAILLNRDSRGYFWHMVGLSLAFGATIPAFFLATSPLIVASKKELVDRYLLTIDNALLGWLYPEGQLSLWLDQSELFNPSTIIGKIYTEIFQLAYVTYYAIGAITLFTLLFQYWKANKQQSADADLNVLIWRNKLKMYLCGWMGAYYITFFINFAFPGQSPRLYLKDRFQHPLEGFGLAKLLMSASTDDTSYGSFPSGHVGESFIAAIYALYLNKTLGIVLIICAVMISISTQVLRYHYFVDMLGAAAVVCLSLFIGFFYSKNVYEGQIEQIKADYRDAQLRSGMEEVLIKDENTSLQGNNT